MAKLAMKRLILSIATGLLIGQAIWWVQSDPRHDLGEAALGLARRMTYNDSGGAATSRAAPAPGQRRVFDAKAMIAARAVLEKAGT